MSRDVKYFDGFARSYFLNSCRVDPLEASSESDEVSLLVSDNGLSIGKFLFSSLDGAVDVKSREGPLLPGKVLFRIAFSVSIPLELCTSAGFGLTERISFFIALV